MQFWTLVGPVGTILMAPAPRSAEAGSAEATKAAAATRPTRSTRKRAGELLIMRLSDVGPTDRFHSESSTPNAGTPESSGPRAPNRHALDEPHPDTQKWARL